MNRYYVEVEGFYVIADTMAEAERVAKVEVEFFPPKKEKIASIILWDEDIGVKL